MLETYAYLCTLNLIVEVKGLVLGWVGSVELLNKQGPLDKQQRREAGSLCRSGSAIFFNET